jgi:hypothetical protein
VLGNQPPVNIFLLLFFSLVSQPMNWHISNLSHNVKQSNLLFNSVKGVGPVVFYKGFTRAYLDGTTETSSELLEGVLKAVEDISEGKKLVLIDGVGYPSVGSICGISNADTAKVLQAPVILVSKSGVGDAVDSFNLNAWWVTSAPSPSPTISTLWLDSFLLKFL